MLRRALLALALLAGFLAPIEAQAGSRFLTRSAFGPGQVGVQTPTLGALTLTPLTATAGSGFTGTLGSNTVGSALSAAACSDGTTPSLSGTTLTATFAAAGSPTCPVTETLAGATGSPRTTTFTITVSAVSAFTPSLDHSDARNSMYL